jgi:hypothetical protein
MNDIGWCTRCQYPILINSGDDNLAMCDQCRYTFCKKCKEIFHFQTMCPKDYVIQQMKLQQEKEQKRIQQKQEEALEQLKKLEQEKKSSADKAPAKQKYRQILIDLSEENTLLEEVLNAERLESLGTQNCPNCHVRIEKNGGCSHMHCSRCNEHFTWNTISKPAASSNVSLLDYSTHNSMQIESIKEELNNVSDIGSK